MKIASRLYASLAAFALVLAGLAVAAPGAAHAELTEEEQALLATGIFAATAVVLFVAIDENGDDDEAPQSP